MMMLMMMVFRLLILFIPTENAHHPTKSCFAFLLNVLLFFQQDFSCGIRCNPFSTLFAFSGFPPMTDFVVAVIVP